MTGTTSSPGEEIVGLDLHRLLTPAAAGPGRAVSGFALRNRRADVRELNAPRGRTMIDSDFVEESNGASNPSDEA